MNILREGDKAAKALQKIRGEREAALQLIKTVERAPLAASDIKTRISAMLDSRIRKDVAERRAAALHEARVEGGRPQLQEFGWAEMILMLGREAVEQRLLDAALADLKAQGREHGLPAHEREDRIAELRNQVRELEIAEVKEMCALEDRGFTVIPRRDTDVALLLEVWCELGGGPPADDFRGADPATKPEHINDGAHLHRAPD